MNRMSRRQLLRRAFIGGSGLLAAYTVGCGDGEKPAAPAASPTARPTHSEAPRPGTPAPTPGVLRWRRMEVSGTLPAGRTDHSIVTDGRTLLLFGGRNDSGTLGDLWAYDIAAGTWSERAAAGAPPARFGHNAVYDTRLGGLVVFGGQAGGSFFNDVWVYDGAQWAEIPADPRPAQRYGAASALDPNGRLLVSHGFTNQGRFDDTWSLSPPVAGWTDLSAAGTRPLKRCLIRGVWDIKRDRFLIFGGQTDGQPFLGDLWALDAAGWQEITSEPKPSPRNFYAMAATDSASVVLFGGNTVDGPGPTNDLWFLDTSNDTWTQVLVEGEAPSPRYGHDAVWLPDTRRLIVSGGHDTTGDLDELWELTIPA